MHSALADRRGGRAPRVFALALLAAAVALLPAALTASGQPSQKGKAFAPDAAYVPGELLVGVGKGAGAAASQQLHAQVGAQLAQRFAPLGVDHVRLPKGLSVPEAIARYQRIPGVRYAEPNYLRHAFATPNDPQYGDQWAWPRIKADLAWDITTGSEAVVVADIDTGMDYDHPDLVANVWTNPGEAPGDGLDNDGNGYIDDVHGIDPANGDCDPMDDEGHGTHTAGTIGAVGDNGVAVCGANWRVRIMPLKFLDASGSGSDAGAIACLVYAAVMRNQLGINIVATNNSWGGGGYGQSLKDAFDACGQAGMVSCCAAGNESSDNDAHPAYPASYTSASIISVAASNQADAKAGFSNWGATSVDLAAPGVGILSTVPGTGTDSWDGTSMATPHVAGAVALIASKQGGLSGTGIKTLILQTVDRLPQWEGLCVSGGRLNLLPCVSPYPQVTSTEPLDGAVQVALDTPLRLWFSQPMNRASVESSFVLLRYGAQDVPGSWSWEDDYSASFTPSEPLTWKAGYTATLTGDATSQAAGGLDGNGNGAAEGSPADDYSWSFTTTAPSAPLCTLVAPRDGERIAGLYVCQASADAAPTAAITSVAFEYAPGTPTSRQYASTATLTIPDGGPPITDTVAVNVHDSVARLAVYVSITHSYIGDLTVGLTSPSGKKVTLHDRSGAGGNNLVGTYPTTLTPAQSLDGLLGDDPLGTWTLTVQDHEELDEGTLEGWRLELGTQAWTSIGTDANGPSIAGLWEAPWDTAALPAGKYSVRATATDTYDSTGQDRNDGVVVNPANPVVRLVRPEEGAYVRGGSYLCRATAAPPPDATVQSVTFSYQDLGSTTLPRAPELAIPDNAPAVVDTLYCPLRGNLTDLQVYVRITHTYIGDLVVTLVSPSGTRVVLHQRSGGSQDDLVGTYPTTLTPAQSLDLLKSEPIRGKWLLKVRDSAGGDTGTLHEWKLTLAYPFWHTIGQDTDGPNARGYWTAPWDTTQLADGLALLRATAETDTGGLGSDTHEVTIDNTAPVISQVSDAPDPFGASTCIRFTLSEVCRARLEVFSSPDLSEGSLVRRLNLRWRSAGASYQWWNGRDDQGAVVPTGTYYYLITAVDRAGNWALPVAGDVTKS